MRQQHQEQKPSESTEKRAVHAGSSVQWSSSHGNKDGQGPGLAGPRESNYKEFSFSPMDSLELLADFIC